MSCRHNISRGKEFLSVRKHCALLTSGFYMQIKNSILDTRRILVDKKTWRPPRRWTVIILLQHRLRENPTQAYLIWWKCLKPPFLQNSFPVSLDMEVSVRQSNFQIGSNALFNCLWEQSVGIEVMAQRKFHVNIIIFFVGNRDCVYILQITLL